MAAMPKRRGFVARLLGKGAPPPRGLYLWGSVGRGKSMLMDLFHDCVDFEPKRRVHFHEFMLEVHDRLREERKKESGDPIPPVVDAIAAEAKLLRSEEHTSELQSLMRISYAVFCLKKKKTEK